MSLPLPQSNGRRDEFSPAPKRSSSLGLDPLTDPTPSAANLVSLQRVLAPLPQVGAGKDMPSHPPVRPSFSGTFRGLDLPRPDADDPPPREVEPQSRFDPWPVEKQAEVESQLAEYQSVESHDVEVAPEAAAALDAIEARMSNGTGNPSIESKRARDGRGVTILCWSIIVITLSFVSFILFAPMSWQRAVGSLFR